MHSSKKKSNNKVALVTGSAKNVGKAIALFLSKEQINVVVHYNKSKDAAEEVLKQVTDNGVEGIIVQADVTKYNEVENMFNKIYDRFGKVDILVNNVGNFLFKSTLEISAEEWEEIISSNLHSTFYCCKLVTESMIRNKYGRIINIGVASCDKIKACNLVVPYSIAKTGVLILTKSLAVALAKYNITVNMVSPGIVEETAEISKEEIERMPSKRLTKFEDITNTVKFFISDESSYVNGTNIDVSGGWNV